MKPNHRVLLGMSGGTDSSVAALLLQDAGYEVTGVTFRFYEPGGTTEYLDDARALCLRLGMEHIVYDARDVFRRQIIRYFVREYFAGRTPVPCTLCNNLLKWPLLRQLADERGIHYLATGHYVQRLTVDGLHYIHAGTDPDKDQSFFLWALPQDILGRVLFPLGDRLKADIRRLAAERGMTKAAGKRDSLGVCFCPGDYRDFLRAEGTPDSIRQGWFIDEQGTYLGRHRGYPFYTIGQRRGLGLNLNRPLFVKEIHPDTNRIVLAAYQALERNDMLLQDWTLTDPARVIDRDDVIVKIRYRHQANRCTVTAAPGGRLHVALHEPLAAIAAGQAAVFYRDNTVLGGGIIV